MVKAIGSNMNLQEFECGLALLYYETVKDLIDLPSVQQLDCCLQHLNTSRLQHAINVSFYSFRVARLLGRDYRAAARAGLLHDLYYYEFKHQDLTCAEHSALHARLALANARKLTAIDHIEEDIILKHMWPMTKGAPKYLESYIVTMADKGCTVCEVLKQLPRLLKGAMPVKRLAQAWFGAEKEEAAS